MIYIWQNNRKRTEITSDKRTNFKFDIEFTNEKWAIKNLIMLVKND